MIPSGAEQLEGHASLSAKVAITGSAYDYICNLRLRGLLVRILEIQVPVMAFI